MLIPQLPSGSPQDLAFNLSDLLAIDHEFTTDTAHYGNRDNTVICIRNWDDWRTEICSVKPQSWFPTLGPDNPHYDSHYSDCHVTPEPGLLLVLGAMCLLLSLVALFKRPQVISALFE